MLANAKWGQNGSKNHFVKKQVLELNFATSTNLG
jgi:hypothetical protein